MKKKFLFGKTWFFEELKLGEKSLSTWGFVIEKEVFSKKTPFQKIEIFDNSELGRVLVLDGLVQLSTHHEFIYHEMLVHPALFDHPHPQIVLIIGGGDGGVLREVVKHPVKKIYLVDIDKEVISVSKKYLPSVSAGAFQDKRVKIFNEDGLKFIKKFQNFFDIIINDSTDPYGPSQVLWKTFFYRQIKKALNKKGIAAFQTAYFREKFARKAIKKIKKIFPYLKIHRAHVGCFPFDEHTFSIVSKEIDFEKITPNYIQNKFKKLKLKTKYYSPSIHFASAILPHYLKRISK